MTCQCQKSTTACKTEFQYAIKIICGEVGCAAPNGPVAATPPLAPGRYRTAINIHNPEKCDDANLRWKVAVALRGEQGPVSNFTRMTRLGPDGAMDIDCDLARQLFPNLPPFFTGFVVIESDIELDVVAVYTASQETDLTTFSTERVPARCVPVCEDLFLPLHTGVADWKTLAGASAVVLTGLHSNWAPAPSGSSWVSQLAADLSGAGAGNRSYQLCFDLCSGFQAPAITPIQVLADNSIAVFLNGSTVGTVAHPAFGTPAALSIPAALLRAGRNCLRVDINNTDGPTGFAIAGNLRVAKGKCPCSVLPILSRQPVPGMARVDDDNGNNSDEM